MIHILRPATILALLMLAAGLPTQAQTNCGNAAPVGTRGDGPSGPDGPGYRPQPPVGSVATAPQGAPAPGFAADQSGRTATAYIARGNEPGWSAEVSVSRPRTMTVKTDNGATTYEVRSLRARAQSWSGTAVDGTAVRLNCGPAPCQDTMSGLVYPGTATLVVGKKSFKGCGGFRD